ncbi:MAG: transglycosylase SLT domain-containing protein, partial [candidate division Zixibacteria bacterium]|nr:transglycosylase SLT domain-containing protein [candidate division Zixibacteria bacterium]
MLEMADEAVSRQLAQTGMLGVGDMLYRHLSERIDADGADERLQLPACRAPALRRHAPASYGRFHSEIRRAAQETGLSPRLIGAVIKQESAGDPKAVSRKGAVGLMQLMPAIAVQMGVRNRFDPAANVLGGAKYLRALLVQFKKLELTLVAYNAGPEAVKRH